MPTLISQTNTRGQIDLANTLESIPLLENKKVQIILTNGAQSTDGGQVYAVDPSILVEDELYVMNISVVLDNSGLRVITRSVPSLAGGEGRQEPCGGMTRTHNTERL